MFFKEIIGSSTVLVIFDGSEGVPGAEQCGGERGLLSIDGREVSGRFAASSMFPQVEKLKSRTLALLTTSYEIAGAGAAGKAAKLTSDDEFSRSF